MPLQSAIFLTREDLRSFEHFVSVDGPEHTRTMNTLDVIGASICKDALNRGSSDVTYSPKVIPENKGVSPLLAQISLSSPDHDRAALGEAISSFIDDLAYFKQVGQT